MRKYWSKRFRSSRTECAEKERQIRERWRHFHHGHPLEGSFHEGAWILRCRYIERKMSILKNQFASKYELLTSIFRILPPRRSIIASTFSSMSVEKVETCFCKPNCIVKPFRDSLTFEGLSSVADTRASKLQSKLF